MKKDCMSGISLRILSNTRGGVKSTRLELRPVSHDPQHRE